MATSATIILKTKEGNYKSIYLHNDGYPDWAGKVLKNHYTTYEKVDELLNLGNLSAIGYQPVEHPNGWNKDIFTLFDPKVMQENAKYCISYAARGEKSQEALTDQSLHDALGGTSYNYLYEDGKWYIVDDRGERKPL